MKISHQLSDVKMALSHWRTPEAIRKRVNQFDSHTMLAKPGCEFLRDAWVAAGLCKAIDAEAARLVADRWPDFEITTGDSIKSFEHVEAIDPARRRGDEYKRISDTVRPDPAEDWEKRAAAAPVWILRACMKKAEKRYSSKTNLIVYLSSVGEYGTRHKEVIASFGAATEPASNCFESVWMLWKDCVYCVWEDGKLNASYRHAFRPPDAWILSNA